MTGKKPAILRTMKINSRRLLQIRFSADSFFRSRIKGSYGEMAETKTGDSEDDENKFTSLVTKPDFRRLLIQKPRMGFTKGDEVIDEIAAMPETEKLGRLGSGR